MRKLTLVALLLIAFIFLMGQNESPLYGESGAGSSTPKDTPSTQESKKTKELWREPVTEMEFVLMPGGTFNMGSPDNEPCRSEIEGPVHEVRLDSFYMSRYEVTQAQWRKVMGGNPSRFSGCDDCPVEMVSWDDVQEFIAKFKKESKHNFRLPTEAEWEYACRAGTTGVFNTGNDLPSDSCSISLKPNALERAGWYRMNSKYKTHPVGMKEPNAFGLFDMHGNVSEWCFDCGNGEFYASSPKYNPINNRSSCIGRVLRGGGWDSGAPSCRSAKRTWGLWNKPYEDMGFRLVREK